MKHPRSGFSYQPICSADEGGMYKIMKYTQYLDVNSFYNAVNDTLMLHESQNIIPLGNALIGIRGEDKTGWRDPVNWFMATVSDNDGIILVGIMTPPHNLALYAANHQNNPQAITCLLEGMATSGIIIPGILAEKSLAEMFAPIYCARHLKTSKIQMDQRVYELTEVNKAITKAPLRLAQERDISFLPYWSEHFVQEGFDSHMTVSDNIESYYQVIRRGRRYIMEDNGVPVSMVAITRELTTVCVIAAVYTPPYFRKKGYATAAVAAASQIGISKGYKKCVLYTDLANPTSNSIYQKIGYKAIGDSLMIGFV